MTVLVVGGGPAGMGAALGAAEQGARVVLVDGGARLGGQYHRQPPPELGAAPPVELIEAVAGHPLVKVVSGARVWRIEPGLRAWVTGAEPIDAGAVVLAPGAHDRPLPFPGWDLPGVMTPGGAQALVKGSQVLPGERVLVAGTGPFLLAVAALLARSGSRVAAVLEANGSAARDWLRHPGALAVGALTGRVGEGTEYLAALRRARVPLRAGWGVVAARPGPDGCVAEADVARLDARWRELPGTRRTLAVDCVCAGYGFIAALELPLQLGCRAVADADDGSPVIDVDEYGRSSVDGVFVAGEATGIGGAALARVEGEIAGRAAAGGSVPRGLRARRRALERFASALRAVHAVPDGWASGVPGEVVVCRCEEVTAGAIRHAVVELGATDGRSVKLQCRAGMGLCQGRMCAASVDAITAAAVGAPPAGPPGLVTRPLAEPVTLAELAGYDDGTASR